MDPNAEQNNASTVSKDIKGKPAPKSIGNVHKKKPPRRNIHNDSVPVMEWNVNTGVFKCTLPSFQPSNNWKPSNAAQNRRRRENQKKNKGNAQSAVAKEEANKDPTENKDFKVNDKPKDIDEPKQNDDSKENDVEDMTA